MHIEHLIGSDFIELSYQKVQFQNRYGLLKPKMFYLRSSTANQRVACGGCPHLTASSVAHIPLCSGPVWKRDPFFTEPVLCG